MLEANIIELVEESEWISPMVIQDKKQGRWIRICIELRKLNDACLQKDIRLETKLLHDGNRRPSYGPCTTEVQKLPIGKTL
jgi:hypothetical protein